MITKVTACAVATSCYIHRVQKKRDHGFFCITLTNVDTVS